MVSTFCCSGTLLCILLSLLFLNLNSAWLRFCSNYSFCTSLVFTSMNLLWANLYISTLVFVQNLFKRLIEIIVIVFRFCKIVKSYTRFLRHFLSIFYYFLFGRFLFLYDRSTFFRSFVFIYIRVASDCFRLLKFFSLIWVFCYF